MRCATLYMQLRLWYIHYTHNIFQWNQSSVDIAVFFFLCRRMWIILSWIEIISRREIHMNLVSILSECVNPAKLTQLLIFFRSIFFTNYHHQCGIEGSESNDFNKKKFNSLTYFSFFPLCAVLPLRKIAQNSRNTTEQMRFAKTTICNIVIHLIFLGLQSSFMRTFHGKTKLFEPLWIGWTRSYALELATQ